MWEMEKKMDLWEKKNNEAVGKYWEKDGFVGKR